MEPNPRRLGWFVLHLTSVLGALSLALLYGESSSGPNYLLLLPLSLVTGLSYAGLAFVAHEALHGAITRRAWLKNWIGRIGFAPFCLSPKQWVAWHNRVHHGHTNVEGRDPDAYPSLAEYNSSTTARLAVQLGAPRLGKWRGIITFLCGFSLQSAQILLMAKKRGHLSKRHYRAALIETLLVVSFWLSWAVMLGPVRFLFLYIVPLLIANVIVMSYIVTNHSLNPLVEHDDALASSLSVTVPRFYEVFSLQFGYHVEHHLFPGMSHVHGPRVQDELVRLAPERYHSLPLRKALHMILTTPRVYQDRAMLLDPDSGLQVATLGQKRELLQPLDDSGLALSSQSEPAEITQIRVRTELGPSEHPPRDESDSRGRRSSPA